MNLVIESDSLETTLSIGAALGEVLEGHEAIELTSDLGGGKTALAKGIAAGLGCKDTVQSPTFTISRIYRCDRGLELHHFDFYRLTDAGVMAAELAESLADRQAVVIVEWPGVVEGILPPERIRINIVATGEQTRRLEVAIPDQLTSVQEVLRPFSKGAAK